MILRSGSPLDSLGFVTFISDLEKRLSAVTEMTKVLAREVAPMNINRKIIAQSYMVTDATSSFNAEYAPTF